MKYIITEEQYKRLIGKKQTQKVVKEIVEKIDRMRNNLNEGKLLNEGIVDTLKTYLRKGLLTTSVIAGLLESHRVSTQDLANAGVPQRKT